MKLSKQMIVTLIEEEIEEALRRNPTLSPERLHQLRVKFAKQDPENAGFTQYWMALGQDHINVEDMEELLTPEEYELYVAGWQRGKASQENFWSPLDAPGLPPGTSRQAIGQQRRFSGWDAPKKHLYNKGKKE